VVLSNIALYRYECPLTAPLHLGGESWEVRRGLLLRIETEKGRVGWGDAAPLPGFSSESLEAVVERARTAASRWRGISLPDVGNALEHVWGAFPDRDDIPASLRFARDSALAELLAQSADTTLPDVLGASRSTVTLNALITDPLEKGVEQAAQSREQGYEAVKVKVGRASIQREINGLREIRRALAPHVVLRADANRAWSLDEAAHFAEATRDLDLAYVEEPLADPTRLSDLATRTGLPVALDETTRETGPEMLRGNGGVSAVVLKPTLLGLRATKRWSRAATSNEAVPVISAAYESGVGLRMLLALAASGPDVPVGLSTYDRFAADVLAPPLPLAGPTVEVGAVADAPGAMDETRLTLVDSVGS